MIPEVVVLRLYGSLVRFIRPGRVLVFLLLVFGTSHKFYIFLKEEFFYGNVLSVYESLKSQFLETSFVLVAVSFLLSFFLIPMLNKFVLESFAKHQYQYSNVLVEMVNREVVESYNNIKIEFYRRESNEASNKIKKMFYIQEAFLGAIGYALMLFVVLNEAIWLLVSLPLIAIYLLLSFKFVRSIMVLYIKRIYFFNRYLKERNKRQENDVIEEL